MPKSGPQRGGSPPQPKEAKKGTKAGSNPAGRPVKSLRGFPTISSDEQRRRAADASKAAPKNGCDPNSEAEESRPAEAPDC